MATVRAKFKVDSIERQRCSVKGTEKDANGNTIYVPGEVRSVKLTPVYGNGDPNHENTKFWNASPSGGIQLGCANLEAAEAFELGQEFYVDFTPAPPAP